VIKSTINSKICLLSDKTTTEVLFHVKYNMIA